MYLSRAGPMCCQYCCTFSSKLADGCGNLLKQLTSSQDRPLRLVMRPSLVALERPPVLLNRDASPVIDKVGSERDSPMVVILGEIGILMSELNCQCEEMWACSDACLAPDTVLHHTAGAMGIPTSCLELEPG
mmetsp:Transcript_111046/g.192566  ORF Transcript_111046/g.192566 Transcript_111046/m.192566 type:complete len:132 (-) Transcript_111046:8-403(-)